MFAGARVTRSGFLKGLAAFGAAPVVGCAAPSVIGRRGASDALSHACIGVGGMGLADLKGLMNHPRIRIAALCDVDSERLEVASKLCPGARLYRNAHEMLAAEEGRIDSVNVSTPDHTHAEYILDALGRGINVYAQKPLCRTIADSRRIEALAAEKGVVTQMGTQIAAHECDRQTVAMLRSGVIGEIRQVWIFSNRGGQSCANHTWPLEPSPVPSTLDWKTWLGPAPWRDYVKGAYHPAAWRRWRDFGTSWLGDLGLHLLSPVWIGMDLGGSEPLEVKAEYTVESPELMRQFWPRNSHVTWKMPGVAATGGKPFGIEWCDGSIVARDAMAKGDSGEFSAKSMKIDGSGVKASMDPKYFPPAFFAELFAKTAIGKQPLEGRVVEGTEGWLLSVHCHASPAVVLKSGRVVAPPAVGPAPSHWHEYVNCCLDGGTPTSSFAWAGRLSEMVIRGNEAMVIPG